MKKIISLLSILVTLTFSACDKVKSPYNELEVPPVDTSTSATKVRKVLIEDYTGHRCPNCPRAAEQIKLLKQARPGRVVAIGVHVTNQFAAPGSGIYNIDFRTALGNSLDSTFKVSLLGLPTGMVNRKKVGAVYNIPYTQWGAYLDTFIQKPAEAYIKIENSYEAATRTVTATVTSEFLTSLSGNYKLSVYIIEDSIAHAQKDQLIPSPSNDSDYVHEHVLRGSLNSVFGEQLNTAPVNSTSSFTKTYSKVLSAAWREKKCQIVAFIYDEATKEVIQAEEKEVIE
ncbi:MAG: Omp28 family outer membrane lipoprotein [Bacteroidetes bacterium]|nr:Omp28 family outer membrane lipoprotein [Bacteroidota bacterium]